ncbi:putative AlkP superfamily pyrophosphatase or phosphodiesterase [Algoriphagus aquaeductus]|uniref:Putative AlkP superfamily pyrophosphatase or phosphodiesterase n=1 Tax=Algoriphagus aquaeductus TaxID=475299 RepID=A0A326RW75_9BACT|nr:ectonucleotide pyrophosphatase/phosphodiesterase [Algoriphagus aquaeductus]PZV86486.1 putative AlkP superfamily pyrophosphatase or phosphodiesterase [Algoriphagus aquaeductus]
MNNIRIVIAIASLALGLGIGYPAANAQNQPSQHVVLISIDGFRPDFYLDPSWPAPNLQEMASQGARAEGVTGVFPSVTYPSHTTIVTGRTPAAHGIYYNSPFESGGQTGRWYWETEKIKVPTLWDAVRKAGMKSASFIWPVSVGAPIDYNLPEFWSLEEGFGRIEPMRNEENPKGLLAELEEQVLGKLNERTFNGDYLNREDRIGEMAGYVLETYKPNLITLHLIATDHFQHVEGREGPMVRKSLAATDRAIGKIIETAERAGILDQTTFIVTGDHGFVNIHSSLSPNVWLVDAGLMENRPDRGNWKATFHTSGASAFLHLKDPKDQKTLDQVKSILDNLPENHKKLFRVVSKEELAQIGADPNAALALAPIRGVSFSPSSQGGLLKPAKGGTHGFFPDFDEIETGFIAWGAGIQSNVEIQEMSLVDVAAVVDYLLNLKMDLPESNLYPGIKK